MPNYTNNYITITCNTEAEAVQIKEFIAGNDTPFDFNKLIPMPESLNMTSGSEEDDAIAAYLNRYPELVEDEKIIKLILEKSRIVPFAPKDRLKWINDEKRLAELVDLGRKYVNNYIKYGATTWYEWCITHWGTKWNACHADVSRYKNELHIDFDTAWSYPEPVVTKLSKLFPTASMHMRAIEETLRFAFEWDIKNGVVTREEDITDEIRKEWGWEADDERGEETDDELREATDDEWGEATDDEWF